jgi:hypothetical protein
MKQIMLVTLDITDPSNDNEELFDTLKNQGSWWHYMKWTWLIYTDKTPEEIVDNLTPYVKGHGRMLVAPLTGSYQGILPKKAWDWIHRKENDE